MVCKVTPIDVRMLAWTMGIALMLGGVALRAAELDAGEPAHGASRAIGPHDRDAGHGAPHEHDHSGRDGEAHEHGRHGHDLPPPFYFSLRGNWLDEWPHSHFSRSSAPLVHFFHIEPAFLGQDLFFDFAWTKTADAQEFELTTELEWAFTRRLGVAIEAPAAIVVPRGGDQEAGFGDFVVAPRFLLYDGWGMLVAANLEISTPTGDESRGLGAGETRIGPSLTAWMDLGNWWTASARVGVETGLVSGENEVVYDFGIVRSWLGPALFCGACCVDHARHATQGHRHGHSHPGGHAHDDETHFVAGMMHLLWELNARTVTSGDEAGRSTGEMLMGLSYSLTPDLEARVAFQFPLFNPRDLDSRVILGFIRHF